MAQSRKTLRICLLLWMVASASPGARGQYAWSAHLSPRPTGHEAVRFGSWDLEVLSLRGMVDCDFYESDRFLAQSVRSIRETTRATGPDGRPFGPAFRRSQTDVDRNGRVRRIEYLDPLTKKVIQRESLSYDESGRLVRWSRSRSPSEVKVASRTRTLYPGSEPYGMAQTFDYYEGGALREWRACTVSFDQKLQDCAEDFVRLDADGFIIEYGWSGQVTRFDRDGHGQVTSIMTRRLGAEAWETIEVTDVDGVLVEMRDDHVVGRSFFDDRRRLVQYQAVSEESPDYYTTATWSYGEDGQVRSISKSFESFSFGRDDEGRIITVDQTMIPRAVRRTFGAGGRLESQQPPLNYRRLNPTAVGEEMFEYDEHGLLSSVGVTDESGTPIARTELAYQRRGTASGLARSRPGR